MVRCDFGSVGTCRAGFSFFLLRRNKKVLAVRDFKRWISYHNRVPFSRKGCFRFRVRP